MKASTLTAALFLTSVLACGENNAATPAPPASSASADSSTATTEGLAADCPEGNEGDPPTAATPEAVNAWLQTRSYQCWARESAPHPSAGPRGGNVRTYLNASLDSSLRAKGDEHPRGAVTVKELYKSGTSTVMGWAVAVKTTEQSADGDGWYWYEVFSTTPGASGAIEGQGKALCVDCHATGRDFIRVPYPLR